MQRPLVIAAFAASISTAVAAQSDQTFPCTNGGFTRRVEIAYAGAGDLPCEVRYFKEGDATPYVLWCATTKSGYCEAQARDFVAKLEGIGWVCSDSGRAPAPSAAVTPRAGDDDTDVLGAGTKR